MTIRLAVMLCALALAACATKGEVRQGRESGRDVAAYLPLAVGNSWTYERNFLGEKGEETVSIVGEEKGFFVDNKGNGFKVDAYGIRDARRYLLGTPVEAGTTWKSQTSVSSLERYEILEAGVTCEVPAGRFEDCVRVRSKNRIDRARTMVNEITFAPGVGMVRFEFFLETPDRRIPQGQMVLKAYDVKGTRPQG